MKNSILRKLSKCALVVGIAFINTVPVSAENHSEHSCDCTVHEAEVLQDISTYARVCNKCGNGTLSIVSTSYGAWYNDHEVKCTHHVYGTDMIQKRSVTTTYRCDYCNYGYSSTSTQTRTVCHGYDF